MYRKLEKAYYIWQVIFSVAAIIFGAFYCVRCLLISQVFCALGFAVIAYVCGYRLFLQTALRELRQFNAKHSRS